MMQAAPMAQPNVFPVQTQVVGQTRVVPVQTISTGAVTGQRNRQQDNVVPKGKSQIVIRVMPQIVLRVICSVS